MTHIHLIGIGGAGMSVIADLLHAEGWTVTGSDARASATTERLADSGITLWIGTEPERLSADTLVAVSSAIREDNPELARARQLGARVIHRSQALALASGDRDFVA
ncbi:Mur ligase domain-containing protein, partial [Actinotignum timonense]